MRTAMTRVLFLLIALGVVGVAQAVLAASPAALGAKGTWKSDDGELTGGWKATFVVEEYSPEGSIQRIGGTIVVDGMPGVTGGKVSGDIKPGTIKFGILYDDNELATFSGTVARGAKLIGTYTRPDGRGGQWEGNWTHAEGDASSPEPKPTPIAR